MFRRKKKKDDQVNIAPEFAKNRRRRRWAKIGLGIVSAVVGIAVGAVVAIFAGIPTLGAAAPIGALAGTGAGSALYAAGMAYIDRRYPKNLELTEKVQTLEREKAEQSVQIDHLRDNIDGMEVQYTALLAQADKKIVSQEAEIEGLVHDITEARQLLFRQGQEIDNLKAKLHERETFSALDSDETVNDFAQKIRELEADNRMLRNALEAEDYSRYQAEQGQNYLSGKFQAIIEEKSQLASMLQEQEQAIHALGEVIAQKDQALKTAQQNLEGLWNDQLAYAGQEEKIDELKSTIRRQEQQIQSLEESATQADQYLKIDALEAENTRIKTQLAQQETVLKKTKRQASLVRDDQQETQAELEAAWQENIELKKTISQLRAQTEHNDAAISSEESQSLEVELDQSYMEQAISQERQEKEKAQQALEDLKSQLTQSVWPEVQALRERNARLEEQNKTLKAGTMASYATQRRTSLPAHPSLNAQRAKQRKGASPLRHELPKPPSPKKSKGKDKENATFDARMRPPKHT